MSGPERFPPVTSKRRRPKPKPPGEGEVLAHIHRLLHEVGEVLVDLHRKVDHMSKQNDQVQADLGRLQTAVSKISSALEGIKSDIADFRSAAVDQLSPETLQQLDDITTKVESTADALTALDAENPAAPPPPPVDPNL